MGKTDDWLPQLCLSLNALMTLQECHGSCKSNPKNMYGSIAEVPTNCPAICFQQDTALIFLPCWMTKKDVTIVCLWWYRR